MLLTRIAGKILFSLHEFPLFVVYVSQYGVFSLFMIWNKLQAYYNITKLKKLNH